MTGFDGAQIVIISSIEWDAAWQRHQIFASQLARAGHEVFFIENTGFRNPRLKDAARLRERLSRLLKSPRHRAHAPARLHVVSPAVLPPTRSSFRRLNDALFVPALVQRMRALGLKPGALAIFYSPTATTLSLLDHLEPSAVVYDCASNFRGHADAPADLAAIEKKLLARASLVVTDSDFLFEQKKREHANVVQIHQGVSERFFAARPPSGRWRSFCYYGTWVADFNHEYLTALADAGYEVTISGFIKGPLPAHPGIRVLPPTEPEKLVERLEEYDAFILPHRINEFMRGVIPAKIYECLAMGRPVLAAPLPSLKPLKDYVYIAERPAEWAEIARSLPKTESAELRRRRVELARDHTHEREFERLRARLRQAWCSAPAADASSPASRRSVLEFAQGFGRLGLLYGAARGLTLAGQILAGRLLGPAEFGRANLIVAMAAFLQVLPMLGFPVALAKFPAEHISEEARTRLISTALTAFGLWIFVSLGLVRLVPRLVAAAGLRASPELWPYAVALAFLTALYTVLASPLLGLRRFAARGAAEALYGLLAPVALLALYAGGLRDFRTLIAALCAALLASSAAAGWSIRRYLRPAFDLAALRRVSGYAALASLNLLTAACVIAPARLIIHHHFDPRDVGVFSAYFTATAQLGLAALAIAGAVLVPLASPAEGQAKAWGVLGRLFWPLAAGGLALFVATATAGLALFGRQYPLDWVWVLAFAAAADLILLHGVASALYSARDLAGLRVSVTGGVVAAGANVGLSLLLIPRFGILGAAAALAGGYALGLVYFFAGNARMFNLRTT